MNKWVGNTIFSFRATLRYRDVAHAALAARPNYFIYYIRGVQARDGQWKCKPVPWRFEAEPTLNQNLHLVHWWKWSNVTWPMVFPLESITCYKPQVAVLPSTWRWQHTALPQLAKMQTPFSPSDLHKHLYIQSPSVTTTGKKSPKWTVWRVDFKTDG